VDEIRPWRAGDPDTGSFLIRNPAGDLSLPVWPDHVGSLRSRWGCYRQSPRGLIDSPPGPAWTAIRPLE
jgi:hypothetical protein